MRRSRLLALVVAVAAAIVPIGGVRAADQFVFYGSGWGHGLGLSQWGAYGLAKAGWNHTRILTHFYTGTSVIRDGKAPGEIRVELAAGERRIHLRAEAGPVRLWTKEPLTGIAVGTIPAGDEWTVVAADGGYRVLDAAGAIVGGHPWGGPGSSLYVTYQDGGARVAVPEGGATYNRGHLEFDLTNCAATCRMRLILPIGFEPYLLGIGEVPSSWPKQALQTQAVAARSFALYQIRSHGLQPSCECHVTDGANDQVYAGWDKEGGTDGNRWVAAVQATAGQIVSFGGHVALTVFSASDGGHTEDLNVQWGTPLSAYPYLAGVCDPGEYTPANPWTDWNRTFSAAKLTTLLATYTGDIGTVTAFVHIDRGVSGRIDRMEVSGSTGGATISGGELRTALGLPDDRVWINADKNVLGPIRVKYDALMCKPGLPTSVRTSVPGGSRQAFETGAIYRNAGIDLQVWLRGALYREYLDVGGATGRLGLPTSNPVAATAHRRAARCPTGCTRADFAGGAIFWKGGLGAFALWGRVLETYLGHGGPAGELGFPTSRLEAGNGATSATFEHGTIRCPASGNCRIS